MTCFEPWGVLKGHSNDPRRGFEKHYVPLLTLLRLCPLLILSVLPGFHAPSVQTLQSREFLLLITEGKLQINARKVFKALLLA